MALAATDLGIDNIIWAGAAGAVAQNAELGKKVGIPVGFKPVLCASFGYAANPTEAREHTISVNLFLFLYDEEEKEDSFKFT